MPPAFYETLSCRLLCTASALLLVWLLFVIRIGRIKRGIRREMEARHAERERIARDLHDTLFQGMQGVLLQMQAWESAADMPDVRRQEIERAILVTRAIVLEGRERLLSLRSTHQPIFDLQKLLEQAAEDECRIGPARLVITVSGRPRPLLSEPCRQLVDIAREAVRNASRHARATLITLDIEYEPASVRIRVSDDGRGIAPEILRQGGRRGHFGLIGMRERAALLSADLVIDRNIPTGTRVSVTLQTGHIANKTMFFCRVPGA